MKSSRTNRYINEMWKEIAQHNDYAIPEDAKRFFYSIVKVI